MTALYIAFAAGIAAGSVLTFGCVAVMAARKLDEQELPEPYTDGELFVASGGQLLPLLPLGREG